MRQWNVRDGLYFCNFQYPQVGLPLVEPIKRIVIGTEILRHSELPSNGAVEHPTKCGTIDRSRMDAEANDPACVLIHDHKDPVGPHRSRFAPEQIHAPEAVASLRCVLISTDNLLRWVERGGTYWFWLCSGRIAVVVLFGALALVAQFVY
jgi:hypothetical protein